VGLVLPSILAAIGAHISDDPQIVNRVGDLRSREAALFGAASLGLTVPTQSLEFLAVPLLEGQIPGQDPNRTVHGVLGTPLYVATSR
jgi:hypothetical protein